MTVVHGRKYNDLETEVLPWLHENWSQLQIQQVGSELSLDQQLFVCPFKYINNVLTRLCDNWCKPYSKYSCYVEDVIYQGEVI